MAIAMIPIPIQRPWLKMCSTPLYAHVCDEATGECMHPTATESRCNRKRGRAPGLMMMSCLLYVICFPHYRRISPGLSQKQCQKLKRAKSDEDTHRHARGQTQTPKIRTPEMVASRAQFHLILADAQVAFVAAVGKSFPVQLETVSVDLVAVSFCATKRRVQCIEAGKVGRQIPSFVALGRRYMGKGIMPLQCCCHMQRQSQRRQSSLRHMFASTAASGLPNYIKFGLNGTSYTTLKHKFTLQRQIGTLQRHFRTLQRQSCLCLRHSRVVTQRQCDMPAANLNHAAAVSQPCCRRCANAAAGFLLSVAVLNASCVKFTFNSSTQPPLDAVGALLRRYNLFLGVAPLLNCAESIIINRNATIRRRTRHRGNYKEAVGPR
ncbi:hypothetical protein B0H13DRAFT_1885832 [Mycena leptocephala]|nr:hypothetical protein B0H13DRAFT_1885832 [Mycena leptocephala]